MGLLEKGGMETDYPASKACRLPEVCGPESSNMRARFSVAPDTSLHGSLTPFQILNCTQNIVARQSVSFCVSFCLISAHLILSRSIFQSLGYARE